MSRLTRSARGRDCALRLPGICSFDPETTILAHASSGIMGGKVEDWHAFFCCSSCHAVFDGHDQRWRDFGKDTLRAYALQAVHETQQAWVREGLLIVAD